MFIQKPFTPLGQEVRIDADAAAPVGAQVSLTAANYDEGDGAYRIVNSGTTAVNLGIGTTSAEAQANAVAPTVGTPQSSITLAAGGVEIMRFGKDKFFSGLSTATAPLFISPGKGS